MMWLLWVAVAAVANAFMDIVENENFNQSIFKDWNPMFWYKRQSWNNARKIFAYKVDGWHLAKSTMVVSLAAAAVTYEPIFNWYLDIVLFGVVWNSVFGLSYKLFRK